MKLLTARVMSSRVLMVLFADGGKGHHHRQPPHVAHRGLDAGVDLRCILFAAPHVTRESDTSLVAKIIVAAVMKHFSVHHRPCASRTLPPVTCCSTTGGCHQRSASSAVKTRQAAFLGARRGALLRER